MKKLKLVSFSLFSALAYLAVPFHMAHADVSLEKAFSPSSIFSGGPSTLTLSLRAFDAAPATGAAVLTAPLVDSLVGTTITPTSLVATISPAACVGSITAVVTATSITVSGTIPANTTCVVSVPVTSTVQGAHRNFVDNFTAVQNATTVESNDSEATLTVTAPSVEKAFDPAEVCTCEVAVLTITLRNPLGVAAPITQLVDNLNSNIDVGDVINTCGGTVSVIGSTIRLTGGSIPANGFCSIIARVSSERPGRYRNTIDIGALVVGPGNGTNLSAASATLKVLSDRRDQE